MMTIHEVSRLAGVSVRTLHHYDAIGLLPPTKLSPAGYRLYDDTALARLQTILLFRELSFPLRDIKRLLDDPGFSRTEALKDQIQLLELRQEQLGRLIALARDTLKGERIPMNFDAFDKTEYRQYEAEVKEKWGATKAYAEYLERGDDSHAAGLMACFTALGKQKHLSAASPEAQAEVGKLQQYITAHFYTCTPEILAGLGEMYIADERFRRSIDEAGGEGTAAFASRAIRAYCGK